VRTDAVDHGFGSLRTAGLGLRLPWTDSSYSGGCHSGSDTILTVTDKLPVIRNRAPQSFYGVNGAQASWVEYDVTTKTYAIKLMVLGTGVTRVLPVQPKQPRFLSMSRDLLVWRDIYWHGYSMLKDQFFTIPYAPVELENKPGIIVTAKDTAVEWSYTTNAHDYVRFTAPIITK